MVWQLLGDCEVIPDTSHGSPVAVCLCNAVPHGLLSWSYTLTHLYTHTHIYIYTVPSLTKNWFNYGEIYS